MTEPDQQQDPADDTSGTDLAAELAKWKAQARKHEERAKGNADAARRLADLEAATATEQDKAVKAAVQQARADTLREVTPRVVRAEFRAAAKGVLTREQTDALLEDLDLSKYVTDTGDVDEDRVSRKVQAFAPARQDDSGDRFPDLGQGQRKQAKQSPAEFGQQMLAKRYGTTSK